MIFFSNIRQNQDSAKNLPVDWQILMPILSSTLKFFLRLTIIGALPSYMNLLSVPCGGHVEVLGTPGTVQSWQQTGHRAAGRSQGSGQPCWRPCDSHTGKDENQRALADKTATSRRRPASQEPREQMVVLGAGLHGFASSNTWYKT
jgi:hypothetical protein